MPRVFKRFGLRFFLIPAFLLYFISESFLRQAAVSNISPATMDVDSIVADLPLFLRARVSAQIEMGKLRDSIVAAKTDGQKAFTMLNMADFLGGSSESEKIVLYEEVLGRYPNIKESARAYYFFLLNPDTETLVSIEDYYEFMRNLDPESRFFAWQSGISKLRNLKKDAHFRLFFLKPLLDIDPEFKEYFSLYRSIARNAEDAGELSIAEQAREMLDLCLKKPSLYSFQSDGKTGE